MVILDKIIFCDASFDHTSQYIQLQLHGCVFMKNSHKNCKNIYLNRTENGMTKSVGPDQTALIWVCPVCSGISVPILRIYMAF